MSRAKETLEIGSRINIKRSDGEWERALLFLLTRKLLQPLMCGVVISSVKVRLFKFCTRVSRLFRFLSAHPRKRNIDVFCCA